jgi:hypothetical protein
MPHISEEAAGLPGPWKSETEVAVQLPLPGIVRLVFEQELKAGIFCLRW